MCKKTTPQGVVGGLFDGEGEGGWFVGAAVEFVPFLLSADLNGFRFRIGEHGTNIGDTRGIKRGQV